MGVCLSRCGDAQQKAGVVAATISHQNSLDLKTSELYDSNHSLKKFLHLYDLAEAKKALSSPRASLGESLQIPHSSELFSLPDSDAERSSCCISPSPARTSRASVSSRATTSPKSTRNSFSVWGGRFSTDRTIAVGCRKKIRPARSSKSLTSDQDLAAHQRLVEAIARLERLNGGKNLELRGSSFCSSDLEKKTQVLSKSRSGELKRSRYSASGGHYSRLGRHGRHYQPYQPSLPLFESTALPKSHESKPQSCGDPDQSDDTSHCCSRTKGPGPSKRTSFVADAASMLPPETFSQPKTMGNLVSLAAPIIKQMPLEKSVTNFLKEVENFVSLIEAPRLSLSSEAAQERKSGHHEPLIITTYSRSLEDGEYGTRLPSYRFEDTDSDEQFTFFEASFEDCELREKESRAVEKSLKRLVNAAAHEQQMVSTTAKSLASDEVGAVPAMNSSKISTEDEIPVQNSSSIPNVVLETAKTTDKAMPTEELLISVDPGFELKPKAKAADASRPALTEIDPNVMPITKKSPTVNKSPLKVRAPKGFRRGFSRSLDSKDGSVTKVDFNIFSNGPTQLVPRLHTASESTQAEVITLEAKSTELVFEAALITSILDGKLEDAEAPKELE
ncbi:hypothetical protein KC19_1G121400 [Ceratodon purpureus]|uniref:Uncharacterized protein n=1 Tax=Ceratodon purpureus TaxID=3225 RepID=A0A8T0J477_CERPU|nr:hypothetical protein KC19_1G121400 [Ceratodon purpureus]